MRRRSRRRGGVGALLVELKEQGLEGVGEDGQELERELEVAWTERDGSGDGSAGDRAEQIKQGDELGLESRRRSIGSTRGRIQ